MHTGYRRGSLPILLLSALFLIFIESCNDGGSNGNSSNPSNPSIKEWSTAESIQTSNADDSYSPQVAMGRSGKAIAVWQQHEGTRNKIRANYYNGTSWGIDELLENDDAYDAFAPQIAMDSGGNAMAVWSQYDGQYYSIYANYFDGSAWSGAELIETTNTGHAQKPQVAMDGEGKAIAVWQQTSGIWVNYFDPGAEGNGDEEGTGKWGTAVPIGSDKVDSPQIAMNNDGKAMVVWSRQQSFPYDIYADYYDGTSWSGAKVIDSNDDGNAYSPQIAIDADGNAIAVWQQYNGFRYNVWANYFDVVTEEEAAADEEAVNEWGIAYLIENYNTGDAVMPQIAMNGAGTAMAIWSQSDGSRYNIWTKFFNGTSWDTAELLEADDVGDASLPQIAMDANGNAMAVWLQFDGMQYSLYANYFDRISWDDAELLETDNAGDADVPRISMDSTGHAMAVWLQFDGMQYSVYANGFQ